MADRSWISSLTKRSLARLIQALQKGKGKLSKIGLTPSEIRKQFTTGMFNVLIVGRSGAGKSTLVNAIFEGDLATTGSSEPVTMETRKYTKKGVPLAVYDTRGLELKHCDQILNELLTFVKDNRREEAHKRIHVAWLCIVEDGRRVEEAEKELTQRLFQLSIPVIGVITKARADQGFESAVRSLLPETRNVVQVRAIEEHLDGGYVLPPMGLENLIEATAQVLPGGEVLRTFASVQKSLSLKKEQAQRDVGIATLLATGAGGIPIPLASEGLLVPIQVEMLRSISKTFGIKADSPEFWTALVGGLAASLVGVTIGVRSLGHILKFIPGVGMLTGAVILSSSSAILTMKLGDWYINFLVKRIQNGKGVSPSLDMIKEGFKEFSDKMQKRDFKVVP